MLAWRPLIAAIVILGACSDRDGAGVRDEIRAGFTVITVDKARGTFGLSWSGVPDVRIQGACSRVYLDKGWIGPEEYNGPPQVHWEQGYAGTNVVRVRQSGGGTLPDLVTEIRLKPGEQFATITAFVENLTAGSFQVQGLEPVSCRLLSQGFLWVGPEPAEDVVFVNGHASWAYTGVVRVRSGPLNQDKSGRIFTDQELLQMGNNVVTLPQALQMLGSGWDELQAGLSWWVTAIHSPGSGDALVAGALTADRWKTAILLEYDPETIGEQNSPQGVPFSQVRVVCGLTGDRLPLRPGQSIASEEVLVGAWQDGLQGLDRYGEEVGTRVSPSQVKRHDKEPLLGWSSWSAYYEEVSEDKILGQARFVQRHLAPLGYRLVQLDDGYERAWGDWRPNERFPSGLKSLCDEITGMGLIPGVWIAPFLVDETIPLVQEHPDWFLRDDRGAPIRYLVLPFYVKRPLDMTHPEARAFVFQNMRDLREAGFRFFKVDFLFGASYEGQHYLPEETGLSTLRSALRLVRDAVGDEAWILLVQAPWLAGSEVGDYYRQSFDVVYSFWGPAWPFFEAEARGSAARYFSHNRLFRSDPDHVLIRAPLSQEEARTVASYAALTGGLWLLGDVVSELPPERLALVTDPGILALLESQEAAQPIDLFAHADQFPCLEPTITFVAEKLHVPRWSDAQLPSIWSRPDQGGGSTVGVFNWGDELKPGPWGMERLGLDAGTSYQVEDLWTGETWVTSSSRLDFELPSHNVRLLRFLPLGRGDQHQ